VAHRDSRVAPSLDTIPDDEDVIAEQDLLLCHR